MSRRRSYEALLRKLKKRLSNARASLRQGDEAGALEEIDWAILELEGDIELEAEG